MEQGQSRQYFVVSPNGDVEGAMSITFTPARLAGGRIYTSNPSGVIDILMTLTKDDEFARAIGKRFIKDHRVSGKTLSESVRSDTVNIVPTESLLGAEK